MPAISKIRFTNVVYEAGAKRYNDSTFFFDGHNSAIVLENGGGKTVFIQAALQAVIPHTDLAGRKMRETLQLENGPAHIAIEWLLADKPRRRYAVTCVTLFMNSGSLDSYRYVYEYGDQDEHGIENLPFIQTTERGIRASDKGEMQDYYQSMVQRFKTQAQQFDKIGEYRHYLEHQLQIVATEWEAVVKINSNEGGVEAFFEECKTTSHLVDRLLIPTIETSMQGYDQKGFANLFQAQRDGFKQYRELKLKIETNERIIEQLERYVQDFAMYNEQKKIYLQLRKSAFAAWTYVQQAEANHRERMNELERHQTKLGAEKESLERERQSLQIALEQEKSEALRTVLSEVEEEIEQQQERLAIRESEQASILYAQSREKGREAEQKQAFAESALARIDLTEDEVELEQSWIENSRQLKFVWGSGEQRLIEQQQREQEELEQIKLQLHRTNQESTEQNQILGTWKQEDARLEENIKNFRLRLHELSRAILDNPMTESVEDRLPIWREEHHRLEQALLTAHAKMAELEQRKERLRRLLEDGRTELGETKEELALLRSEYQRYEQDHDDVRLRLAELRPQWARLISIPEKEQSIRQRISQEIPIKEAEKADLYRQERLARRHIDDYGEQETFFADPYAAQLLHRWSGQFSLLQSGVDYVQQHGSIEFDRLWALTLITTEAEREKLQNKVRQAADHLQFPIRVLSTDEARDLHRGVGNLQDEHWIEPSLWHSIEDPTAFEAWKNEAAEQAAYAERARISKERELQLWNEAERQLNVLLHRYPAEARHASELRRSELADRQQKLTDRIAAQTRDESQNEHEQKELQIRQELSRQQTKDLEYRMDQGAQYVTLKGKTVEAEQERRELSVKLKQQEQALEETRRRILERQDEQREAERRVNSVTHELKHWREEDLYIAVIAEQPLQNEFTLETLKAVRQELGRRRDHIASSRSELEREIERCRTNRAEADQAMKQILQQYPNLDRMFDLPSRAAERLETLWIDMDMLKSKLSKLNLEKNRRNEEYQQQVGLLNGEQSRYAKQFDGEPPIKFLESLSRIAERVEEENKRLTKEEQRLEELMQAARKQYKGLEKAREVWLRYLVVHQLQDPALKIDYTPLTLSEQNDWLYAMRERSEQTVSQLEAQKQKVDEEKRKVTTSQKRFVDFCDRHVPDLKQSQMAKNGIAEKQEYTELREFEHLLKQNLLRANQVAETHMQAEDKKLQHYITHIHDHIKQLTQELGEIPKKTRVKTSEGSKEIYAFRIPQWDEKLARENIQNHIDWIGRQLDGAKYVDESGEAQDAIVRKDLERWLDSRQLLLKVLGENAVRIQCRKVGNDNRVTSASYSWETSNSWSGGERWSKNMALFLGLLNYVAEKRQPIQSKMARHRSVILDNPFGKASSEHVLSPVFYIAEQLGFQIIALTAHAEGKFLHDYFPVLYSCRLRSASGDSSKQIVDIRQNMNQAYFRDLEPEVIAYLGETKQIELF
ncbi:hypothetical protein [Saccharibacillus sp. JS10]|uniref:hypothetical protein n=1 Tax=Saccharibacillus sp. JS10 TaxID=2950552 RepID=UPI00210B18AF|nr:hypothetical protein [Saccharibacillus sp. JS10]MCQ4085938.1 hypothetical protein [Saccharibacillus sp. JS10]